MKTLEETKKGLEICYHSVGCDECPYRYKPWADGCRCVDGLQSDALAHIEQLESQIPRWIPVEERLPEKMKIVLVFKRRTAHFIWSDAMWNIETDWCGEDGWSKNPHNGCFAVTHWMPMPEPPEEAKTNG